MIKEQQSSEDLLVMCRICEKKTDAALIVNHLANCQQVFEARKQLHQLDVQIQKLDEQSQTCYRSLNTKFQIHKQKQARHGESKQMRSSAPLKSSQSDDGASDETGSRTMKCVVKSRFANLAIKKSDDEEMTDESVKIIQIVKENIDGDELEKIMDQQSLKGQTIGAQKSRMSFIQSPQPEMKQISSPISSNVGSPFSLDDNSEIIRELKMQMNCIQIITKYTEEIIKSHRGNLSIQFDLQAQVDLFNVKCTLQKEVQDLVKQALKLIEERVQCLQKIIRLQKIIQDEDKIDLASPARIIKPLNQQQNSNRRTSLGNSLQEHFENLKQNGNISKWLNKQNNAISNFDNNQPQMQSKTFTEGVGKNCIFSQCLTESDDDSSSNCSREVNKLEEHESPSNSFKIDNQSHEVQVQQSRSNVISFKDLNRISKDPDSFNDHGIKQHLETEDEDEEKARGYYSDGDLKSTKYQIKNKQLLNVTLQDFEFIQVLGIGAFGAVWLVYKKKTKDYYAMKVIDCRNKNMNEIKNLRAEKNVFEILEGDFVVKAFYSFIQDNCLLFLLEYMKGGDFSQVLYQYGRVSEEVAKFYLAELLLAIESLHKKGIIHRDLKPQNILLDASGHLKLADFGLSEIALAQKIRDGKDGLKTYTSIDPEALPQNASKRFIKTKKNIEFHINRISKCSIQEKNQSSGKRQNRIIGTPDYIPPEVISGQSISNFTIDWWAFGVIMYEFLIGIPPFNDQTIPKVFENILNRQIEWPEIGDEEDMLSKKAFDLINKLLEPNYQIRLGSNGADEIKAHSFFSGIDWSNIRNKEAPIIPVRDFDQLEEEESDITKKKNEEVKMKDRLQSVQVSHDGGNLDGIADLTRVDLLAKISEKDAENVMKKRSIRKNILNNQNFL